MPGNVQRQFLDWSRPCLAAAAEALADRYAAADGSLDMVRAIIVLPGARAGRRLLELLLEQSEQRHLRLLPPRIVTAGVLIDLLHTPPLPVADDLTRRRAWAMALQRLDADALASLVPQPPQPDDSPAWDALAQLAEKLHENLASELLTFADVPAKAQQTLAHFADHTRWAALAEAHRIYRDLLEQARRVDMQDARLAAIAEHHCHCEADIHLIAVAEMPGQLRAMLSQLDTPVTAWIHAPAGSADSFDPFGTLNPDAWRNISVPMRDDQIVIVSRPIDQATAAATAIAELNGAYPADQITLGVCDAEISPFLHQRLSASNLPIRDAAGMPLPRTAPCRLLDTLGRFIAERRYSQFAALIRHPDLADYLTSCDDRAVQAIDDWTQFLDRYYNDHLQSRLTGDWLGDSPLRDRMAALWRTLHQNLLAPLTGSRPLSQWAQPILDLLLTIFGRRDLDRTDPADRLVIESCTTITSVLSQLAELPEAFDESIAAGRAIALVLSQLTTKTIPPEPLDPAIEMLGSLELHLDDASALIVTGFNEGRWPQSVNADAFLPDALRHALGLMDNDRRYARDIYQLSAILHSRPHVKIIAGRLSVQGDPLIPSRLLFAISEDDPSAVARRILRFYQPDAVTADRLAPLHRPAARSAFSLPPQKTITLSQPVAHLSVTDFRAILEDPYRFALRHEYGLQPLDDAALELDASTFGNLAHVILDQWAHSDLRDSTDPHAIAHFLSDSLAQRAETLFRHVAQPAVKVQISQLRARLNAFADWQARHAADGWRVRCTERSFTDDRAALIVDELPMVLRGRIDRIDFNESLNQWAIIDYKTSDSAKSPEQVHRTGPRGGRLWVDLQLPLYRHLFAALADEEGFDGSVIHNPSRLLLGYVLLPRDTVNVGFSAADWSAKEWVDADAVAADVVRLVRAGRFTFNPDTVVRYDDFAELCGVNQFIDDDDEPEGAEA